MSPTISVMLRLLMLICDSEYGAVQLHDGEQPGLFIRLTGDAWKIDIELAVSQSIRASWVVDLALGTGRSPPRTPATMPIDVYRRRVVIYRGGLRYHRLDRRSALMYFTASPLLSQRTRPAAQRGCLSGDNDDLR